MSTTVKIFYAAAFQLGWLVCTIFGHWFSLVYSIAFIAIHFLVLSTHTSAKLSTPATKIPTNKRILLKKEALWIIVVFVSGFLLETISFSNGLLVSNSPVAIAQITLPPLWLANLWLLFAIALRTCLSFVFVRIRLTYLIASVAIPLNYYAGAALNNDVAVSDPYIVNLAIISLLWIFLLWILNRIKHRYFEDIF